MSPPRARASPRRRPVRSRSRSPPRADRAQIRLSPICSLVLGLGLIFGDPRRGGRGLVTPVAVASGVCWSASVFGSSGATGSAAAPDPDVLFALELAVAFGFVAGAGALGNGR